ncbi:hypothetical protein [Dokdonella sp.]|uniref:hypothetical protein n=1 Tax=Dokdonella sp. TaxID=2291710 RepID=UPI002D7F36F8|nr:hypothetical protein [Dokdonella sp.]
MLEALAGVSVMDRHVQHSQAMFHIDIRNEAVARRLQYLCTAANVELTPPMRSIDRRGLQAEVIRRFSILACYRPFDSVEFGYLQLLGIHLVWHLHGVGVLSPDAADKLLRHWRAAEVGVRGSGGT